MHAVFQKYFSYRAIKVCIKYIKPKELVTIFHFSNITKMEIKNKFNHSSIDDHDKEHDQLLRVY